MIFKFLFGGVCKVSNTEGQASFTSRKPTSLFFVLQLSTNLIAVRGL